MIKKIYSAKINNEKTVEIWGTGMPIREWLYVEDGAESLIKSTELKSGCYFYNIGVNKGISIIEMSKLIAEIIGWDGEFVFDTSKPDGAKEKRDEILIDVDNEKIVEIQTQASEMFEKLRKGEKIEMLKD